jgi:hypothetical protein
MISVKPYQGISCLIPGNMIKPAENNDNTQKEMFRLLKIFGLASLGLVFLLSFFNDYRANNSGEDPTFTIKDAGLLFFYNLRRIDYRLTRLPEAKIEIYTNDAFEKDSTKNGILLDIIINKNNQTAFLYLKPQGVFGTAKNLRLRNGNLPEAKPFTLETGTADRHIHLEAAKKIALWLQEEEGSVEVYVDKNWLPLTSEIKEKEAFINTYNDFLKITANK